MVKVPNNNAIDWHTSTSNIPTIDSKFSHSHTYPEPHTHSHPHDISHSHSHSYLEYNYDLIKLTTNDDGTISSTTNPENIHIALNKQEENKLIHLDPVPDFKDKADIKPWLQKIFYPQGIEIVIERSDNTKVVFKCKASKRGRNAKEPVLTDDQKEKQNSQSLNDIKERNKRKKRSVSRFNVCPFRIRATYSLKRKKWSIVVMNNLHSHDIQLNPDSDEYKKFKAKLKEDNDIEAVKKFDELEYRIRANLPIQNSMIPCDCGLTSEIQSFNIVLPNTTAPSRHSPVINSANSSVTKPSLKKKKDSLYKKTTEINLLSLNTKTNSSNTTPNAEPNSNFIVHNIPNQINDLENQNISDFIDDQLISNGNIFSSNSNNTHSYLPMSLTEVPEMLDLNEIDFTNIFTRSFNSTVHNNETNINTKPGTTMSNKLAIDQLSKDFDLIRDLNPSSPLFYQTLNNGNHNNNNQDNDILNDSTSILNSNHTLSFDYPNPHQTTDLLLNFPSGESPIYARGASTLRKSISVPMNKDTYNEETVHTYEKKLDEDQKELTAFSTTHTPNSTSITSDLYELNKFKITDNDLTIVKPEYNDKKLPENNEHLSSWLMTLNHPQSQ